MKKQFFRDITITISVLTIFFLISLAVQAAFHTQALIPPLFVLAVFLIAMSTDGYIFGIVAALLSVLAVNYAFTFPFFAFGFTIQENVISAIILLVVTMTTSTLSTTIKKQEKIKLRAEKERMRADLLRAVSHDLRTPLTAIYGASSTVAENYHALSDAQKLDILGGIQTESQWLIRMVENLLSITRIDNSNVRLHTSSVVLEELVDTVLAKFQKNYPQQPVELHMPEAFIVLSADPILIQQVLINLLENAVLHAVGMTQLTLNIYTKENTAVFEVSDDGYGIEKEKLKNIFSGYYMEENTLCDNQKRCMGIGLSVCSAIIHAHGGEISAENLKKGGAMFRFSLLLEEMCDE